MSNACASASATAFADAMCTPASPQVREPEISDRVRGDLRSARRVVAGRKSHRNRIHFAQVVASTALALFSAITLPAQGLVRESAATPMSWIQLRNGTTNAGNVSGTLRVTWRFHALRPVRGIAVADGKVVLGTESADADASPDAFADDQRGFVTALDAYSGKRIWTRAMASWVHGDPAIVDGKVVVAFGRWPMTSGGGISALSLSSGVPLWTVPIDAGAMAAPAVDFGRREVLVVAGDGLLYQISLADGVVRRTIGLQAPDAMSSPRIDSEGKLTFATTSTVWNFSIATGLIDWRYHAPQLRGMGDVPVAATGEAVFTTGTRVTGGVRAARMLPVSRLVALIREQISAPHRPNIRAWFQEQWLIAIDPKSGRLLWRHPLGIGLAVPRNTSGTPVVQDTIVVVSSPVSRTLWAFQSRTGRLLWRRELVSIHKGAVTIVGGDVLLGDKAGMLRFFRLDSGLPEGQCNAGAAFSVLAPIVVGRTLFSATHAGWVYAAPYDEVKRRASARGGMGCFDG